MMKIKQWLTPLIFILNITIVLGQSSKTYMVTYQYYSNGALQPNSSLDVIIQNGVAFLSKPNAAVQTCIDYSKQQQVHFITYENKLYKTVQAFDSLPKPTFTTPTDTVLNYKLQKASFLVFSNHIHAAFTQQLPFAVTPVAGYLPTAKAAVLKLTINGNRSWIASKIDSNNTTPNRPYLYNQAKTITAAEMEEIKIKSRYTAIKIFDNQQINFDSIASVTNIKQMDSGVVYRFSNGTVILKKVNISAYKNKDITVLAQLTCRSNGDAYDRTGSVFAIPASKQNNSLLTGLLQGANTMPFFTDKKGKKYYGYTLTNQYTPAIEWMRFFTSFGVGHFNNKRVINNYHWAKEALYKADISEVFPSNEDEVWIGVFIGNYDKGGHIVNLQLNVHENDVKPLQTPKQILPIVNAVHLMETSGQQYARLYKTDTLTVWFDMPAAKQAHLLYTTTGHGGWENGDEFVPIENTILIDDKPIYTVVPWRTDCASYRLYNPASGNFNNGLSSSDLSRSNWCPATLTPPYRVPLHNIPSGKHKLQIVIKQGNDEGNSFSYWNVSATMVSQ